MTHMRTQLPEDASKVENLAVFYKPSRLLSHGRGVNLASLEWRLGKLLSLFTNVKTTTLVAVTVESEQGLDIKQ
jgi:hypothetical protein